MLAGRTLKKVLPLISTDDTDQKWLLLRLEIGSLKI
jgi:hypothetical protein